MKDYFEEINQNFDNTLAGEGFNSPNDLQAAVLKRIKQGGDLLVIAPKESGKTYAAMLAMMLKCPTPQEGSPRVLYMGDDNEEIVEMAKKMTLVTRRTELFIEVADSKGKMIQQRIFIFQGADVVIGNAKRMYDLYIQNGLNLNKIQLLIVDDADKFMTERAMAEMVRISEGLPKCQRIFFIEKRTPRVERVLSRFLNHPMVIDLTAE